MSLNIKSRRGRFYVSTQKSRNITEPGGTDSGLCQSCFQIRQIRCLQWHHTRFRFLWGEGEVNPQKVLTCSECHSRIHRACERAMMEILAGYRISKRSPHRDVREILRFNWWRLAVLQHKFLPTVPLEYYW